MVEAREEEKCLVLSGSLPEWAEVVRAGRMAVNKKRYIGLINDIECTGESPAPQRAPEITDKLLDGETPDVLIIGGGVVGCAAARELTRHAVEVMLVEKEHDLAMQASGRNDGMVHSGLDLRKGTQKYHYNKLGNPMFDKLCAELGVDFERTGQYLCVNNIFLLPVMHISLIYWRWLGLRKTKVIGRKRLRELEPSVSKKARAALFFPATGAVYPQHLTIAYAENAVRNGARVQMDTIALGMACEDGTIKSVLTNRGTIYPKVVVNAAGVFCEEIAKMACDRFYSIHPRKGTNIILDKKHSGAVVRTALSSLGTASTRSAHTKGGGVIHTVDGNTLVGPDAVETIEKEDFTTTRWSVAGTMARQKLAVPALGPGQTITYFSGVRASTFEEDFVVRKGISTKNLIHAAGIQSPGLTAAPAIGVDVARMAVELLGGEANAKKNHAFDPVRKPIPKLANLGDGDRAKLIAENPDYGIIVCRCEEISRGEIIDALRRDVPCDTVDGVKRRVRPGAGRCQGAFCGPQVMEIIAKEKGIALSEVKKSGDGSEILCGREAR